jgi:phosphoglucosamine mutase
MGRFFGTDGIRGRAGEPPLDPATVQKVGRAIVRALGASAPRVLIGRDTRESGPAIEQHLAAGLAAEGAHAESAGVIPTPAIAHLARQRSVDGPLLNAPSVYQRDLSRAYLRHLARSYSGPSLVGMHLVVDCANGATSFLARSLFEGLGARVTAIHDQPDGRNINRGCGATSPETVADVTRQVGADLGLAFDGDGDRCILADGNGKVIDGDHVLYLAARHLQGTGRLRGGAVVATVMSNVGLEVALGKLGIPLVRAAVGDRNVLEEMERRGANLGGEQSGHVIFLDHEPTGDGLLTGLEVLEVVKHSGRSLAELAAELPVYPQVLRNVRVREKQDIEAIPEVRRALDRARSALDGRGRLVVRYSGTEPLLRVMAEGPDEAEVRALTEEIVNCVGQKLGA